MLFERLLPERLSRVDGDQSRDTAVIHECRHCGLKFDTVRDECSVCESTEIATYTFGETSTSRASDEDSK